MNNYCTNCGEKLETNVKKCSKCGQDVVELPHNNNSILIVLKVFILIFLIMIFGIIIVIAFDKISIKYKGKLYIEKYIIPDLKTKYSTNIGKVKYLEKNNCMQSYSGDCGNMRVKGCYVYSYNVFLKNGENFKAYLKDDNKDISVYNDFTYEDISKDILDYYNKNFNDNAEVRLDSIYDEFFQYNLDRTITIVTNLNSIKVFNKEYSDKFIDLINYSEKYENTRNIGSIVLEIKFNDGYILNYNYFNNEMFNFQNSISNNNFKISVYSSDDIIKWCIDNKQSSNHYTEVNE